MLNPLALPAEVLDQLRAMSEAVRSLPSIERMLDRRFARLETQLDALPEEIERAVRDHFERQLSAVEDMKTELGANRESAELLPPKVDGLLAKMDGLNERIEAVRDEITRVRELVEPLEGPAERLARIDERLPGGG